MDPDYREKTPEKNKPCPNFEFIRTPQIEKEENLYEILIKAPPPQILFPFPNDHSEFHEAN